MDLAADVYDRKTEIEKIKKQFRMQARKIKARTMTTVEKITKANGLHINTDALRHEAEIVRQNIRPIDIRYMVCRDV